VCRREPRHCVGRGRAQHARQRAQEPGLVVGRVGLQTEPPTPGDGPKMAHALFQHFPFFQNFVSYLNIPEILLNFKNS
jgi:hypothetical protein